MNLSKLYLALFIGIPVAATANSTVDTALDAVKVIGLRDSNQYTKEINTTARLGRNEIAQAASVAEALKYVPNVDVQGGARSVAQKPVIRGLTGNRVVQIVDGVRQNFDLAHRGSFVTPMAFIEEVEVVKGPSSTLWGSGALGGVVAMRTSDALDLLRSGEKFGVKISQGYQSVNDLSETNLSAFGANEKFDWLVQGVYKNTDNLRLARLGDLQHSAYTQQGARTKLGWQINPANRVEISHRVSETKQLAPSNNEQASEYTVASLYREIGACYAQRLGHATCSKLYSNLGGVTYLSHQKIIDQSSVLNYYFNPENNPYLNAQLTAYHNRTTEKEERQASGLKDKTQLSTTGVNLKNSSDFNVLSLTYGVDAYQDRINTTRETNNSDGKYRPNGYKAKANSLGAYVLGYIPVGEHFVISPSVRFDSYKSQSGSEKYHQNHWSPSIATTWKATSWFDLTAKYSEAFRAPSLEEKYISGTHFGVDSRHGPSTNTFVANPNLKSEVAKNKEISANFHFDEFSFSATAFQNDVKDFIELKTYGAMHNFPLYSQYQNVQNARLRGFELQSEYRLGAAKFGVSYGQTRGKNKATNEALSNIAADKVSINLGYDVSSAFHLGTRVTHYVAQKRLPSSVTRTYPSYTLTDVFASYAPQQGQLKNIRVDFGVDNVFDKKHTPAFSLINGTGRNAKVNVSYQF